jgi:hypothetical protein
MLCVMQAPGGHLFTSVPCLDIPHMTPVHFQHLTPMGLAVLMEQAGFTVLELGQFGNHFYEQYILSTQRWAGMMTMMLMLMYKPQLSIIVVFVCCR